MKYDETIFKLSEEAYNMLGESNAKNDNEITKKQDKVLKLLFNKFKEKLISDNKTNNGILKVQFESIFYSDFNDGYREIDELVKSKNFDSFASNYCMYLGNIEYRCNEYYNAYYEIIWDYKTYFEQLKAEQTKTKEKAVLPYPVGTYLTTEENGKLHIDQVLKYIIDSDGLSVILTLDALSNPRSSIKININNLLANWNIYNKSQSKIMKRIK